MMRCDVQMIYKNVIFKFQFQSMLMPQTSAIRYQDNKTFYVTDAPQKASVLPEQFFFQASLIFSSTEWSSLLRHTQEEL